MKKPPKDTCGRESGAHNIQAGTRLDLLVARDMVRHVNSSSNKRKISNGPSINPSSTLREHSEASTLVDPDDGQLKETILKNAQKKLDISDGGGYALQAEDNQASQQAAGTK